MVLVTLGKACLLFYSCNCWHALFISALPLVQRGVLGAAAEPDRGAAAGDEQRIPAAPAPGTLSQPRPEPGPGSKPLVPTVPPVHARAELRSLSSRCQSPTLPMLNQIQSFPRKTPSLR